MSTSVSRSAVKANTVSEDMSIGQLVSEATADLQQLMRQEVALAKAEMRDEAKKAVRAGGMFGGAGFAGYMMIVVLSFAAVFGLSHVIDLAWSALVIGGLWGIIAGLMAFVGRMQLRRFSPKPQRTVETLKEDAQWVRHPLGARTDGDGSRQRQAAIEAAHGTPEFVTSPDQAERA